MTWWGKLGAFPTWSPNVLVQISPRLVVLQTLDQELKVIRRLKRADGLPNGLNWTRSRDPRPQNLKAPRRNRKSYWNHLYYSHGDDLYRDSGYDAAGLRFCTCNNGWCQVQEVSGTSGYLTVDCKTTEAGASGFLFLFYFCAAGLAGSKS
jgi:hypothetical protein